MRCRLLCIACLLATGCATHVAGVDRRMLLPETGARYEMASAERFVMPIALDAEDPAFPADVATAASVAVTVCADLWLSANGDITRSAPLYGAGGCEAAPSAALRPYEAAVAEALQHWSFSPAMVCTFADAAAAERAHGDCRGAGVAVRRVPVRIAYAFTFTVRDGRRRVDAARAN
jgi:hypothetical protein